jgi:hypothetical protein
LRIQFWLKLFANLFFKYFFVRVLFRTEKITSRANFQHSQTRH